jgi:multidrug efflux pump subunit AcrB
MWIVRLALRNPYSIGVLALAILIAGILAVQSMLVDVFPVVDIPVVGEVWSFPGLSPEEVEARIVTINERALSTTTSGISRIESQMMPGLGNIRIYFEPGTPMGTAVAQVSATAETVLRVMPPGITPPTILPFNASNVPVAQLTLTSDNLPEQQLFDYGLNFIRVQLFTIPGLATPAPYGGAQRQINVDVDPVRASAKGISPQDVSNALQNQNLIIPAGDARIGALDYQVLLNSSPLRAEEFNRLPVTVVDGRPVLLGDVARAYDGHADQTNLVRINGRRAVFLNILKKAEASTLSVVAAARAKIPEILETAPKGMNVKIDFDQSKFVRATVQGLLFEGAVATTLVSLMILFFLGSWRSVFIVCTSIPLSILVSIFGLKLTGQSINIMTLGGLSLAIGMLVDDATVEVENIHRNMAHAPSLTVAVLRGAHQIALPAIVSTLAICIVFFPILLLTGPAKYLFTPLSIAVVFAMLASYVLSRTLVPVLAKLLLSEHPEGTVPAARAAGRFDRFNAWRDRRLDLLREHYGGLLRHLLVWRKAALGVFALIALIALCLPVFVVGRDFFPAVDTGILKFHLRAPTGLRIENTEVLVTQVEAKLRSIIPPDELSTINVNIGVPTSYNLAFVPTDNVGPMDAEVLIALEEKHHPIESYMRRIREEMDKSFPGTVIYFQPGDIVSQVLNFGLSAPIDIQLTSRDAAQTYELARRLRDQVRLIPGASDVVIRQTFDYPTLHVEVDRERAAETALSQKDIASSMLTALASSSLVQPSYYVNPSNGVNYQVVVKEPLSAVRSIPDLVTTPVSPAAANPIYQQGVLPPQGSPPAAPSQSLGNLSLLRTDNTLSQVNHINVQRVIDLIANPQGRDLGGIVSDIEDAIRKLGPLPPGMRIFVRGQNEVMHESFQKLGLGMILAVVLVYMLMVTLFQSWLDPLIILIAVPGALVGILWMLALTGTTINVESLMGAIMAVGIAVSNSNLLVTFANEIRVESGLGADEAAIHAGMVRLRPVLMTALAMILGMVPMALGLSEGGEQNAPLGRAVIGGLVVATLVTLFLVPVLYSLLRQRLPGKFVIQEHFRQEEEKFGSIRISPAVFGVRA